MSGFTPFEHPDFRDHEDVLFVRDPSVGLFGIVAIHDTTLGPAAGGCRMHAYESPEAALRDVLRLSRGMTCKNAVAGLPLGGGKCVILADPASADKRALLRAFGRHIQALGGRYWTAIDVGVGPEDADVLAETCDYVFCRASQYPDGFNPSRFTALGGFVSIRAAVRHMTGSDDLTGVTVAVQGLGNTGHDLCRRLHAAGARLFVADLVPEAVQAVVRETGAEAVAPEAIHKAVADVFAPCALGGVLNDATIPELGAKAVVGLANNQLEAPRHAEALKARGILYAPDYVVNAGGVIGASQTIFAAPDRAEALRRVEGIGDTVARILRRADAEGRTAAEIADRMAEERLAGEEARGAA